MTRKPRSIRAGAASPAANTRAASKGQERIA